MEVVVDKIKTLSSMRPGLHIYVDRGVKEKSVTKLIDLGANFLLISGGIVFKVTGKYTFINKIMPSEV